AGNSGAHGFAGQAEGNAFANNLNCWPYNIALALLSGCISDTQKILIQYSFDWYLFVTQLYFVAR
ncbi:hypothetical protein, partial [Escherichia coli]|uniref:hypothetical protein n=1 Tax=Escherichia coli TaxID=562 RepID=UPI001BFC8776